MQENLRKYFESDATEKLNENQRPERRQGEGRPWCSTGRMENFNEALPPLLNRGYFLVFFGQLNEPLQASGKMLLLLQPDNLNSLPVEAGITEGRYFLFHADLFKGYNLKGRFNSFGFLRYALAESIILSGAELHIVDALFGLIEQECTSSIYEANPHILISYIELLLQHMHRFYQRSFQEHTTKLLALNKKFDTLLATAFLLGEHSNSVLPALSYFADELGVTTAYLNDTSLKVYGQAAQDRIDNKIIDCAKQLLATSDLSVAEIADRIGFAQPQSLNRLFKRKTKSSPMEYRISLV